MLISGVNRGLGLSMCIQSDLAKQTSSLSQKMQAEKPVKMQK